MIILFRSMLLTTTFSIHNLFTIKFEWNNHWFAIKLKRIQKNKKNRLFTRKQTDAKKNKNKNRLEFSLFKTKKIFNLFRLAKNKKGGGGHLRTFDYLTIIKFRTTPKSHLKNQINQSKIGQNRKKKLKKATNEQS